MLRACYSGFALKKPGVAWLGQEVSLGFALGQYLQQQQVGSATLLTLQQSNGWGVGEVGAALRACGATSLQRYALATWALP